MEGYSTEREPGTSKSPRAPGEKLLIERAQRGDRQAIGELYRRHVDVIYRYVYGRVGDRAIAEDLTAQVFLKALEGLPDYKLGNAPFVAWLYRIAQARTIDHWRRLGRRQEVGLDSSIPDAELQPVEILEVEAEWETAVDLLAQLSDDQQAVILLRFIGEMSLQDVATTLGKTVGAVKSLQYRALASLSRLLRARRASEQDA